MRKAKTQLRQAIHLHFGGSTDESEISCRSPNRKSSLNNEYDATDISACATHSYVRPRTRGLLGTTMQTRGTSPEAARHFPIPPAAKPSGFKQLEIVVSYFGPITCVKSSRLL